MDLIFAAGIVLALIAVAGLLAWLLRRRTPTTRALADEDALPADVLGREPRADITLLQFSTAYCSRCPGNLRVLHAVAEGRSDVAVGEVDLTERAELARQLRILQTPTTFIVDRRGVPKARIGGAMTRDQLESALETAVAETT